MADPLEAYLAKKAQGGDDPLVAYLAQQTPVPIDPQATPYDPRGPRSGSARPPVTNDDEPVTLAPTELSPAQKLAKLQQEHDRGVIAGRLGKPAPLPPASAAARKPSEPQTSVGEAVANRVSQAGTFGFGDEYAAAQGALLSKIPGVRDAAARVFGDPSLANPSLTYQQRRDTMRGRIAASQSEHPYVSAATDLAASVPLAFVPGASAARAATATDLAAAAGLQGAASGLGSSDADLTSGRPEEYARALKDTALSGALSAVVSGGTAKLVRGAPERVDERMLRNIARGEAGGAAKDKLYKKVIAKAGEGAEDLNESLTRSPGLKRTLVTSAASNPGAAAKKVTAAIDTLDSRLTPMIDAIDKGPSVPRAADLQTALIDLRARLKAAGNTGMADVVENFEHHIAKHYGDGDAVFNEAKITASALRKLKQEVGEIAFKSDPTQSTPFREQAKREIYGAINAAIERAGEQTPGVDVAKMRQLNQDMSRFIAVRDALADRAAKATSGRTTLAQNLVAAGAVGGGIAHGIVTGGIEGAVAGAIAGGVVKGATAAKPAVRLADYGLARLTAAARAGSTPAQLAQLGIEFGLSRAAADFLADEISKRVGAER